MRYPWSARLTVPVVMTIFCWGDVNAHDFRSDGAYISSPLSRRPLSEQERSVPGVLRAIIRQYQIYPVGRTLKACFMGGDQQLREFFRDATADWDTNAPGISIDFGPAPYRDCPADGADFNHLRVRFSNDAGSWAEVGTAALEALSSEPTVSIGGIVENSLDRTLIYITEQKLAGDIRHEIGHALGLLHEHTSPDSKCEDEFLWEEQVYPALAKPPNEWDRLEVDAQFRQLISTERLRSTPYDLRSVMHYSIPASWLKSGRSSPCYVTENYELSETDIEAIGEIYPKTQEEQEEFLQRLGGKVVNVARAINIDASLAEPIENIINSALPPQLRGRGIIPNLAVCLNTGNVEHNTGTVTITIGGQDGCNINMR